MEVRDLHVQYPGGRDGPARAVDGVNLDVYEGETLALVGESGCGKTTLARTIMGLQRPTSGEIRFRGEPLSYDRDGMREHRRRAQMIFQDPTGALNARQTLYEAVAEGLRIQRLQGNEEGLVAEALSRAGLRPPESFFTRYPYEISGGQRQRVIIAGAMVLEPEPARGGRAGVGARRLGARRDPVADARAGARRPASRVFVVTHDLGLAWNVADRVAVMYLGRIVEDAPAEQLLTAPRHPYTRALLSVVPETPAHGAADPARRDPGPHAHPGRLPLPPALPVVESGEAARLGIEERCRGEDPLFLPACHAVRLASGDEHEAYLHER